MCKFILKINIFIPFWFRICRGLKQNEKIIKLNILRKPSNRLKPCDNRTFSTDICELFFKCMSVLPHSGQKL